MSEGKDQLISIVGTAYFQPIADLLNHLMSYPYSEPNDVQTGRRENGYSASICILAVVCFESFLMRVRYKNKSHPASKKNIRWIFSSLFTQILNFSIN